MTYRRIQTCTQDGMTPRQPGVSSGTTSGGGAPGCILNVSRHYPDLPNKWGGRGVSKPLDGNGRWFPSVEEAGAYALERGYTRRYFTEPGLRARRVAAARDPRPELAALKARWAERLA